MTNGTDSDALDTPDDAAAWDEGGAEDAREATAHGTHRAGYVVLVGLPNVGKSTLMNRFVGQKLASVTPKPQTTRHRIMGVVTEPGRQVVFLDTPGLLEPRSRLHAAMLRSARQAIAEADVVLAIHDVTRPLDAFAPVLVEVRPPGATLVVALNKIDRVSKPDLLPMLGRVHSETGGAEIVPISALTGDNVDRLLDVIGNVLPEGPPLYPADTLTEHPERFFVSELIREQVLLRFREEVPHAVEVEVERFLEQPGRRDEIDATICVERPSQKRILVGAGGQSIKELGIESRRALEVFLDRPVILRLFVKVVPDWRGDARSLRRMGYE
jgi:GTP-binding protein Era